MANEYDLRPVMIRIDQGTERLNDAMNDLGDQFWNDLSMLSEENRNAVLDKSPILTRLIALHDRLKGLITW